MNFGVTSLAAPNAASSRVARYSRTARPAPAPRSAARHSSPGMERCLLASAAIKLASTPNPSPPTKPSLRLRAYLQSEELVDPSKEVVIRDMIIETEIVEQLRRCHLQSHHRPIPSGINRWMESRHRQSINAD